MSNGALIVYGLIAFLLYRQLFTPAAAGPALAPGPTFWVRTEDGQVVASHTGPPTLSTWGGAWGTWTAADPVTAQVALDSGSLLTIS